MSEMPIPAPSNATAAAPLPRYTVTPYRADGGFNAGGIMMLVGGLMIAGAVFGLIAHFVGQFFWLILVFPVLIGLAMGAVGVRLVKAGRIRNALIGGLAGFAGGAVAMLAMHYMDYESFRKDIAAMTAEMDEEFLEVAKLPPAERASRLADDLNQEGRAELEMLFRIMDIDSFGAFMDFQAEQGVEIGKATSSSSDRNLNLGYTGSWIYWAIEMLIVAGMTYAMVRSATMEPYCAQCEQWKRGQFLGSLRTPQVESAKAAIASGDLSQIAAAGPSPEPGGMIVTAAGCTTCGDQGTVDVKLESLSFDKNNKEQRSTLAHATYPADALPALVSLFKGAPAAPAKTVAMT